jgi:hypothetical protein
MSTFEIINPVRRSTLARWAGAASAAMVALMVGALPAQASELVDRNARNVSLKVNNRGIALVEYTARGKRHHVLYWGAVNANRKRANTLRFKRDRSGGWKSKVADWRDFNDTCGPYTGPSLPYLVTACTASDGSHWALQKWARLTPNYGGKPSTYKKRELRLSHFTGQPAVLTVTPNWSWGGQYMHIVAQLKYRGKPWYAIKFKDNGEVTDKIGRNVTIDSYNSDMGSGWRRVNAVLTHRPSGQLCFGFSPKQMENGQMSGRGLSSVNKYRLTVPGPGVSPDVQLYFDGVRVEDYDPAADDIVDDFIRSLIGNFTGRHSCKRVN